MTTTTKTTESIFVCGWAERYEEDTWKEVAERAVHNGQSENEFLLSCHIANRPAALKAYRTATRQQTEA